MVIPPFDFDDLVRKSFSPSYQNAEEKSFTYIAKLLTYIARRLQRGVTCYSGFEKLTAGV